MTWDVVVSLVTSVIVGAVLAACLHSGIFAAVLTGGISLAITYLVVGYLSHGYWLAGMELVWVSLPPITVGSVILLGKWMRRR